ncbi:MAG: peptide-methionine (R)-S-oxide reductase MsrB [Chitinophagaceae bacterium]|jgi:peptide-methionine (R)-S-oxide reductase|nr:peptide-methionine (R)-S-oxide reductase MsrB [Chitinophagaceae bacterium]
MLNWKKIIDLSKQGNLEPNKRVVKSKEEWKKQLTNDQYYVTREHGTEPRFSGEHCSKYEPGNYSCACCNELLFASAEKFDSGTGWPSFTQPYQENSIKYILDNSWGMERVEVQCNVCDAHLGHVFPDGPAPSKLRYCINSLSLNKEN